MDYIRRGEIALLLLNKMLTDSGILGLRSMYINMEVIAKEHKIPIAETMEFTEAIKLQVINHIRERAATEVQITDPLDEIAARDLKRRASKRDRQGTSGSPMLFHEFTSLCAELFSDCHSFRNESNTRPGAYTTVYTAQIRAVKTDLKLIMSYPLQGSADVNIRVEPHIVEPFINSGPADVKLREFAKHLLAE